MESAVKTSQFSELVRYSKGMMTAAGVLTLVIMLIGVMGNFLTIVALLRHKKIRTVAAAFIASLCISDLLFCLVVLPFSASQFFHGKWIHGDILCVLIPALRYGSVGVSLLSVATISINRYILIAVPNLYPNIYTKVKVALYISFIWLFSYGLQVPTLFGKWGYYGMDEKLGTCSIMKDANGHSSKTALYVIGFGLPSVTIIICYLKIYLVVRQSHKRLQQHQNGNRYKHSEMKIAKMMLVIFLCFLVCYLPITMVKIFDSDVHQAPLHVMGYLLIYLSACVNPVVYVTMNKQYRQAYLDTLMCSYSSNLDSTQQQPPSNVKGPSNSFMSLNYLKNIVHLPKS